MNLAVTPCSNWRSTTGFHRGSDFLYADDKRTAPSGQRAEAFFKPDWSPDLLLSSNYIGRAWCADLRLVARAKVTIGEIVKYQTYGTVLRLTAAAAAIRHVPSVLFQHVDGPCDPTADRLALKRALKRRGIEGAVCDGVAPGIFRLKRKVPTEGLVSIVIPTCAAQGFDQNLHRIHTRPDALPEFRNHLHRKYSGGSAGVEKLAPLQRGCRFGDA